MTHFKAPADIRLPSELGPADGLGPTGSNLILRLVVKESDKKTDELRDASSKKIISVKENGVNNSANLSLYYIFCK